jgi:hypothetical protein
LLTPKSQLLEFQSTIITSFNLIPSTTLQPKTTTSTKMPVPTADLFDKQQNETNSTQPPSSATHTSTDQRNNNGYFGTAPGSSASALQNADSGRALTKEEADRLYEERMEEEYAKRDGGA